MPYESEAVAAVLEHYGEFRYEDRRSQQMLDSSGLTPEAREEQVLSDKNMEKYTGEWCEANRHGKGKMVLLDGSTYEGYWLNDAKNGFGRYIHVDGDIYLGYWQNDMMHGTGTYTHADGAEYTGEWEND